MWQHRHETGDTAGDPCALAWRPDGHVLAIGHATGTLHLRDLETGSLLYATTCGSAVPITSLTWMAEVLPPDTGFESFYLNEDACTAQPLPKLKDSNDAGYWNCSLPLLLI